MIPAPREFKVIGIAIDGAAPRLRGRRGDEGEGVTASAQLDEA